MRNAGLDILKILAVAAVVVLHAIWAWPWGEKNSFVITDQLLRFSVPLFVAASGYGLMAGYGRGVDLIKFLYKRLKRLLPWYLFTATITILLVSFVWHEQEALYRGASVWRLYLLGQADYHLYFIPMIVQLYLLFPVLLFLFKKTPPKVLVLLVLIGQIGWYGYIGAKTENSFDNNSLWPDQQQYRYFMSWIYYFVLGMYLAGIRGLCAPLRPHFAKASRGFVGQGALGLVLCIMGWGLSVAQSMVLLGDGVNQITALRFTRIPVLVYSTGIILLGKLLIDKLVVSPARGKLLASLANYSYLVYLWHPLVLRVIGRIV